MADALDHTGVTIPRDLSVYIRFRFPEAIAEEPRARWMFLPHRNGNIFLLKRMTGIIEIDNRAPSICAKSVNTVLEASKGCVSEQ